ncbi:MAG: hypothetical protein DUD27_07140 [Lachnospiraceae bacterium]|nr:MAG: hypothetical protein DUD27_07140 [Lachnospiraceae bacterium]
MQNEQINQNDDEITVNLADIFWKILMQWKAILVFSLIVGLAASGIKFVQDFAAYRSTVQVLSQQTSDTKKSKGSEKAKATYSDAEIKQLQNKLSTSKQNEVENALISMRNVLEDQKNYENSIIMQVDPQREHMLYIDYYITDSSEENSALLCQTYQKLLFNNSYLKKISKAINLNINSSDLYKQMTGLLALNYAVSQPGLTTDGKVASGTYPQITVSLVLPKSVNINSVVTVIRDSMTSISNDISNSIGTHTLKYIDSYDRTIVNSDLRNNQSTTRTNIITAQNDIEKKVKEFTPDQTNLFNAELANLKSEMGIDDTQSKSGSSTSQKSVSAVSFKPKFPVQNFAIGFVVCLIAYIIVYIIGAAAGQKVKYGDEASDNTGLRKLGEYHSYNKTGFGKFLWSKRVYDFYYRKYLNLKETSRYTANDISAAMIMKENQAENTNPSSETMLSLKDKNVSILCPGTKSSNVKKFTEAVMIYLKSEGINAKKISSNSDRFTIDPKEINSLGAVVLTVTQGKTNNKELKEFNQMILESNIPVLGYLYVD